MGYEGLERKDTAKAVIIVDHVDVIDLIHFLGLHSHFLDALGHAPVFVDHDHLGAHEAAGGVFAVFEQVDDVACLLHVVDMAYDFITVLLVEFLNHIHGIVGIEVVELLGYLFGLHAAE